MKKTIFAGLLAALGAFAGVALNGTPPKAAEEVRCRVNAEALVRDLLAISPRTLLRLQAEGYVDGLLEPKP